MKTLKPIPFEEAVNGQKYLTKMKHGWIEGTWDAKEGTCTGYYWRDICWYPHELYEIVDDE